MRHGTPAIGDAPDSPPDDKLIERALVEGEVRKSFGTWLSSELEKRAWRQADLARAAGVSQQTASRWLAGRSVPARPHVVALAVALNVSNEELLSRCVPAVQ